MEKKISHLYGRLFVIYTLVLFCFALKAYLKILFIFMTVKFSLFTSIFFLLFSFSFINNYLTVIFCFLSSFPLEFGSSCLSGSIFLLFGCQMYWGTFFI